MLPAQLVLNPAVQPIFSSFGARQFLSLLSPSSSPSLSGQLGFALFDEALRFSSPHADLRDSKKKEKNLLICPLMQKDNVQLYAFNARRLHPTANQRMNLEHIIPKATRDVSKYMHEWLVARFKK